MKTMLLVCLIAAVPALAQEPAPAGIWEGNLHGLKAVTLTIRTAAGFEMRLTGSGAAELTRLKSRGVPEITVALWRLRGV